MTEHIYRDIYLRRGCGFQRIARHVKIALSDPKHERFAGTARIKGKAYVVEQENRKWVINPEHSRALRR